MDCPRCSVELQEISGKDSTLQRCPDCGGLWTDVADLNRVLLHANLTALSALGGYVNPDEIAGQCPACQVDLVAVEGGEKRLLHYDTCESCGGIWTEGPEEGEVTAESDWKTSEAELVAFFRRFARKDGLKK
jgi:Zn-finger nucleic acid-binding protein